VTSLTAGASLSLRWQQEWRGRWHQPSNYAGSGPGGRIVKRDIESAVADAKSQHVAAPTTSQVARPTAPVQLPEIAEASPFRDEPTTEMRRTIARRLVTSIGPVPHFFLTTEIEMDKAAEFRSSLAQIDPNLKVSFNDIVIKVVANSLIKHPAVNASFQDRSIDIMNGPISVLLSQSRTG